MTDDAQTKHINILAKAVSVCALRNVACDITSLVLTDPANRKHTLSSQQGFIHNADLSWQESQWQAKMNGSWDMRVSPEACCMTDEMNGVLGHDFAL